MLDSKLKAFLICRCEVVRRRATMEELKSCHSEKHVQLFGTSINKPIEEDFISIHFAQVQNFRV